MTNKIINTQSSIINNKLSIVNDSHPTHFESLYPEDSRSREIEQALSFIKAGNSCQLIGLPGAGRSTLLGLLSFNHNVRVKHLGENQKWFHFVLCNFSEIRKKSLLEAEKFLFLSLIDSLKDRKFEEEYKKANGIFKESLELNDEQVLFQGIKKTIDLLAIEKELTVVFLFDRFEEYIPMLTPEFFTNLRILRNRAKYRFSVVFSLNRSLEDLIETSLFADFYEFLAGHFVFLPLMDKSGLDFRISYIEKITEKEIEKGILEEIIKLTGGHGKLTRLSIETVIENEKFEYQSTKSETNSKNKKSNDKNVSDLMAFLLEQKVVLKSLSDIWNSLTPSDQQVISNKLEVRSQQSDVDFFLEKVGLLKNGGIAIPLFESFVSEKINLTIEQSNNLAIALDPNTNEIKKGDIILSDQLTSHEYRLLKFLIENKERTVEREEIINAVWKESQTTQGVTDQALDQLIFRLRKKIEADPNNPTHIQTVKGRGIRFTT